MFACQEIAYLRSFYGQIKTRNMLHFTWWHRVTEWRISFLIYGCSRCQAKQAVNSVTQSSISFATIQNGKFHLIQPTENSINSIPAISSKSSTCFSSLSDSISLAAPNLHILNSNATSQHLFSFTRFHVAAWIRLHLLCLPRSHTSPGQHHRMLWKKEEQSDLLPCGSPPGRTMDLAK